MTVENNVLNSPNKDTIRDMKMCDGPLMLSDENSTSVNDRNVVCMLADFVDKNTQVKKNINLNENTTLEEFLKIVAKQFGYVIGTFSVSLEKLNQEENITVEEEERTKTLGDICDRGTRNQFLILEKDGVKVEKEMVDASDDLETGASLISGENTILSKGSKRTTILPHSVFTSNSSNDGGFTGLVNQAMTCYLNSLLQTLYMTPEFRNAIYRWKYIPKQSEISRGQDKSCHKSIPYQLQRLFLNMQTSKKRAVETTNLTKSFGWESSEAWQQHDVQELCRVMFDALETQWAETDQANLINKLYQGYIIDYVKCLECGYESAREDTFLDIPLVIRPFGSDISHRSVMESLEAFVTPEKLEEPNQYECSKCKEKRDAHKGLKFKKLPHLLTLQLKRFDFDYQTMHRIKLNNRMEFPTTLFLNKLIHEESDKSNGRCKGDVYGDLNSLEKSTQKKSDETNSGESNLEKTNVYDLFSIMIHSGSAIGGHYYAYIKNFRDNEWYCFNDQNVQKISPEDIERTYGGSSYSALYSSTTSSANAYMLFYRKVNSNEDFLSEQEFPEHIKKEISKIQEDEELEKREKELENERIRIKAYCCLPGETELQECSIRIHRDKPWDEATNYVYDEFNLNEKYLPRNRTRLVKFEEHCNNICESFDLDEKRKIGELLNCSSSFAPCELLLECRAENEQFENFTSEVGQRVVIR
ncbi:DgyrCDS2416 [Dimorphilus gyrociliatus]|uniref:Ubiquitin carboxyl-terminal hydrolase n=1 Tax=Dimorphilus gyrociliatus TaxID=2664684 RepID=A0A7I8VC24_9ANNE|nr:DgyrCDS2416 [Dimorphilus gyrociliatus]